MKDLKNRLVACIIATVLTLGPSTRVLAETPCPNAVPISTGVKATCTGLLLPENQARECLLCLRVDLPNLKVDLHKVTLELDVRVKSYESLLDVERDRVTRLQTLLNEVSSVPKPGVSWYESPHFWGFTGVFIGSALTFGAIYAATELDK